MLSLSTPMTHVPTAWQARALICLGRIARSGNRLSNPHFLTYKMRIIIMFPLQNRNKDSIIRKKFIEWILLGTDELFFQIDGSPLGYKISLTSNFLLDDFTQILKDG